MNATDLYLRVPLGLRIVVLLASILATTACQFYAPLVPWTFALGILLFCVGAWRLTLNRLYFIWIVALPLAYPLILAVTRTQSAAYGGLAVFIAMIFLCIYFGRTSLTVLVVTFIVYLILGFLAWTSESFDMRFLHRYAPMTSFLAVVALATDGIQLQDWMWILRPKWLRPFRPIIVGVGAGWCGLRDGITESLRLRRNAGVDKWAGTSWGSGLIDRTVLVLYIAMETGDDLGLLWTRWRTAQSNQDGESVL